MLDSPPLSGTLTLDPDGSFAYTPTLDSYGVDAFTYHAADAVADSGVATVTLAVAAVNDPPLAVTDTYTTTEDVPLMIAAPGVLANDGDVEGNGLLAVLDSPPLYGVLVLRVDGSLVYTPALRFSGVDTFRYCAGDTLSASSPATVTITVRAMPRHWLYLPLIYRQD